jgi:hypothetical protein
MEKNPSMLVWLELKPERFKIARLAVGLLNTVMFHSSLDPTRDKIHFLVSSGNNENVMCLPLSCSLPCPHENDLDFTTSGNFFIHILHFAMAFSLLM